MAIAESLKYLILLASGVLLLPHPVLPQTSGKHRENLNCSDTLTDRYISINRINDRLIVLNMGYDAVSAIKSSSGIVVIDAGMSGSLSLKYREKISSHFNKDNFKCLLNTHAHPDHTGGNSVFSDVDIVAHRNCKGEMDNENVDPERITLHLAAICKSYEKELRTLKKGTKEWEEAFCQKLRYQYAYNDKKNDPSLIYPSLYFDDTLSFTAGEFSFYLKYFGKVHSKSDILIYVPELKVLFTGDLFFPYGRLAFEKVSIQDTLQWNRALSWLAKIMPDVNLVIGGHGQVMKKEDLELFISNVEKRKKELE